MDKAPDTINRISLKNFKCFKKADVELSKITLLTGANSSGKSSLIYGILSAFQTSRFPFYLSLNDKYVNMGDFPEISFKHAKDHNIEINISFSDYLKRNIQVNTQWVNDIKTGSPALNKLNVVTLFMSLNVVGKQGNFFLNFKYDKGIDFKILEFSLEKNRLVRLIEKTLDFEGSKDKKQKNIKKLAWSSTEPKEIDKLRFENLEALVNESIDTENIYLYLFMSELFDNFEKLEKKMNFISSFRYQPERTYYQKARSEKIGKFGENYIDQILEWENKKSDKYQELNKILRDLQLLKKIKTKQLSGGRFEILAKVQRKGIFASLADVGFGISQFLPVIVADLQLPKNSTLVLAQPEIHLHPNVQAAMGNYFVNQVNEYSKRYIIETHSEYLLKRIRLCIVKGEIKPSDVAVYYFENSLDGSVVHRLEFLENGQIKNAPDGFFDTYMIDTMNIALNA